MGSEWVRLTPGEQPDNIRYGYLGDTPCPHVIGLRYENMPDRNKKIALSDVEFNILSRYAPEVKAREQQVKALVEVVESATAQMTYLYKGHFGLPFSLKPHMERLTEALAPFTEATDG